jgi:hypothetical protein
MPQMLGMQAQITADPSPWRAAESAGRATERPTTALAVTGAATAGRGQQAQQGRWRLGDVKMPEGQTRPGLLTRREKHLAGRETVLGERVQAAISRRCWGG